VLSLVHDMSDAQGEHVVSPKQSSPWVLTVIFLKLPSVSPVSLRV
jgi:hypothetical protein